MSNQVYSNLVSRTKYPLTGLVVEIPEDNLTIINYDLQLPDLTYDTLNDDIVSIDGVGLLYRTTKINALENTDTLIKSIELTEEPITNETNLKCLSFNDISNKVELTTLGEANPFDQDLNTFDPVRFDNIAIPQPNNLLASVVSSINVNRDGIAAITLSPADFSTPQMQIASSLVGTHADYHLYGCYLNSVGQFIASDTSCFFTRRLRNTTTWEWWATSTPQSVGVELTDLFKTNHFEVGRNIVYTRLTLLSVMNDNARDKVLVWNDTTFNVEYRDVNTLPSGNPFDQDLNTTDSVEFGNTLSTVLSVDVPLKSVGKDTTLACYDEGDTLPFFSVTNSGPRNTTLEGSINLGCYEDIDGKLIMTQTSGCSLFLWNGLTFISALEGAIGTEDLTPTLNIAFKGGLNGYTILKSRFFFGELLSLNSTLSHVCGISDSSTTNQAEKVPRADIFGQDLLTTSSVQFDSLQLDNVLINNIENKLLVLNSSTGDLEYREVSSLPSSAGDVIGPPSSTNNAIAVFDGLTGKLLRNSGIFISLGDNITSTGTITVDTPLLAAEFDPTYVLIKEGNELIKRVLLIDLFGQNLSVISDVRFNDLTANGNVDFPNLPFISSTNNLVTIDGLGNLNKTITTNIDNLGNLVTVGSVNCSLLSTGEGFNDLFPMDQAVLTTSNITFNEILCDNFIKTDDIFERTAMNGVNIVGNNISPQSITTNAILSPTDPLSINMNISGDNQSIIQISAENHDNSNICFDLNHFKTGTTDQYISGSVNGNVIINKAGDSLDVLITNGITKGLSIAKSAMNKVISLAKTSISLNETVTMNGGFIANSLSTDPESQSDSIFITQSSVNNEIYKRPYQSIYGTSVNNTSPLLIALPVIDIYVKPVLNYAMTVSKNILANSDNINIVASMDTFIARVDYAVSFTTGDNAEIPYTFAVNINSFIITGSEVQTIQKNGDEMHNVSCNFLATVNALDPISIVVKNTLDTKPITFHTCTLTVTKIFQ